MEEVLAAVAAPRNDLPVPDDGWLRAVRAYRNGDRATAYLLFAPFIGKEGPYQREAAYRSARCLQRGGDLKTARAYFERLVETDPLDAKSMFRLGEILMEQGEVQRALELRQRAARLNPELFTNDQWD